MKYHETVSPGVAQLAIVREVAADIKVKSEIAIATGTKNGRFTTET